MISRIPDHNFVKCSDCTQRRKQKEMGGGKTRIRYWCNLKNRWLHGQNGCSEGTKKKSYTGYFEFDHTGKASKIVLDDIQERE